MVHQDTDKDDMARARRRQELTYYMTRLTTITTVMIICVVIQDATLRRLRTSAGDPGFAVVTSLLVTCLAALLIGCIAFWAIYTAFEAN